MTFHPLKLLAAATLAVGLGHAVEAATTTIDFTEPEFPGNAVNATNEYLSYGVLFSNAYYYVDSRDPFDRQGISNGDLSDINTPGATGRIDFVGGTTNFFTFDWWTISTNNISVRAYDSGGSLLDQVLNQNGDGTATLNGAGIAYIEWNDSGGFVQLSTISYELAAIPLPASFGLLALGLGGLGLARRKRKAS